MYVTIEIRYSDILDRWSWEVETGEKNAYGFESDYLNAEDQARQAAKRMGAEI